MAIPNRQTDLDAARAGPAAPCAHAREIAAAALAIADSEGIDAVTMRRVARELGAGTMTLYHYVRTKDDLLALMSDALLGELIVPDEALEGGGARRSARSAGGRTRRSSGTRGC